jgi:hypothetical protein
MECSKNVGFCGRATGAQSFSPCRDSRNYRHRIRGDRWVDCIYSDETNVLTNPIVSHGGHEEFQMVLQEKESGQCG